jgi:hypothetical protein
MSAPRKLMKSTISSADSSVTPSSSQGTLATSITTATLAPNAVEAGTVQLTRGFAVKRVTVNAAARVRIYSTQASQIADTGTITGGVPSANRPRTQPPLLGTQHGVILDLFLNTPDKFNWKMSPAAEGFNLDTPPTSQLYYAIDNLSGATQSIIATLLYVQTEEA